MDRGCPRTRFAASRTRRRMTVARFVSALGYGLLGASAGWLGALVVGRLAGWSIDPWISGAGLGIGGVVGAGLWAAVRRPTLLQAAQRLDASHDLDDRLTTALAFSSGGATPGPFEAWAAREGERAAQGVSARRAVRYRAGWAWVAWPTVALLGFGAAVLMPHVARSDAPTLDAPTTEALTGLRQVASELRREPRSEIPDPEREESIRLLEDVERELAGGRLSGEEAAARASEAVDRVAEEFEQRARQEREASRELRERLAQAERVESNESAVEDLVDRLREGDFAGAERAAEALERRLDELSPAERERITRSLRELAERVRESAESAPDPQPAGASEDSAMESSERPGQDSPDAPSREAEDSPRADQPAESDTPKQEEPAPLPESSATPPPGREGGIPPPTGTDEEAIANELREQGLDDATAQKRAEEIARQNRQREAQREAKERAERLAEAIERSANRAESPSQEEQPRGQDSNEPGAESGREEQDSGEKPDSGREGERRDPSGSDGDSGEGSSGTQGDGPDAQPAGEPKQDGAEGVQTQEQQPQEQQGGTSADGSQQQQSEQGQEHSGESSDSGQQSERGDSQGAEQRPAEPGTQQQGQQEGPKQEGARQEDSAGSQEPAEPGGADQPKGTEQGEGAERSTPPAGAQDEPPGTSDEQGPQVVDPASRGSGDKPQPNGADGQSPAGNGDPDASPDGEGTRSEGPAPTQDREQPPVDDRGSLRELRERLREMQDQREQGERDQQRARDLRDRAQRMLEPSPREDGRPTRPGPSPTPGDGGVVERQGTSEDPGRLAERTGEDVDLRDREAEAGARQRVIAEWFTDEDGPRGEMSREPLLEGPIREAAQSAERAIEQQAVPARLGGLLRRVYKRLQTDRPSGG
ncbi:MAG: hypothetical protein H6811_11260 [Phycisphaeraceae bacterium]|nr:hypothetical protein [Phycisphaeraceae bacterium]